MARRVMQRLQNSPFALRSRVRGEVSRLCGAGWLRAEGDRLKRSVPTAALRHEQRAGLRRTRQSRAAVVSFRTSARGSLPLAQSDRRPGDLDPPGTERRG